MKCEDFRELVFDLAEGLLEESRVEEARSHIESCPQCRKEYEECLRVTQALAGLKEETAPESLLPNVMKKIAKEKTVKQLKIVRFGTAAAAAVFLVAGSVAVIPRVMDIRRSEAEITYDGGVEQKTETNDKEMEEASDEAALPQDEYMNSAKEEAGNENQASGGADISGNAVTETAALPQTESMGGEKKAKAEAPAVTNKSTEPAKPEARYSDDASQGAPETEAVLGSRSLDAQMDNVDTAEDADLHSGGTGGIAMYSVAADAGGESEEVIVDEPVKYICRKIEFAVAEEDAQAVSEINTEGKSMARVSAELEALGVRYSVYIIEDDYTEEYISADDERKAEIEGLCSSEICTIVIE